MGDLVLEADGHKDMTGIQRAAGTGGAGGSADAGHIQPQQQRFALDALERDIKVAGQAVLPTAV